MNPEGCISDRERVKLLRAGDEASMLYVFECVVIPVTKKKKHTDIMIQLGLSQGDVYGMFYDKMILNDGLTAFRYEGHLLQWLRINVSGLITEVYRRYVSGPVDWFHHFNGENILDPKDRETRPPNPMETEEKREFLKICFTRLWKSDPLKAYVFMLRYSTETSARDVMQLLDIKNVDSVNTMAMRAKKKMKEFIQSSADHTEHGISDRNQQCKTEQLTL